MADTFTKSSVTEQKDGQTTDTDAASESTTNLSSANLSTATDDLADSKVRNIGARSGTQDQKAPQRFRVIFEIESRNRNVVDPDLVDDC